MQVTKVSEKQDKVKKGAEEGETGHREDETVFRMKFLKGGRF